jgi:hypothetical protein
VGGERDGDKQGALRQLFANRGGPKEKAREPQRWQLLMERECGRGVRGDSSGSSSDDEEVDDGGGGVCEKGVVIRVSSPASSVEIDLTQATPEATKADCVEDVIVLS